MKINTDGVLLGALAEWRAGLEMKKEQRHQPEFILDIGTGTGVIALMLAQRFDNAKVFAVEIDLSAAETAKRNFQNSIFNDRLAVTHADVISYHAAQKFDLIVSNPPYFINDLRNSEEKKGLARHTTETFFMQLMVKVDEIMTDTGCFWFILPVNQAEMLVKIAKDYRLWPSKIIRLYSDRSKSAFRHLVCLNRKEIEAIMEDFYIYEAEKVYTKAYNDLLSDFFLNLSKD